MRAGVPSCMIVAASLAAAAVLCSTPGPAQPAPPGGRAAPALPATVPAAPKESGRTVEITVQDARAEFDPSTGDPVVSVTFDDASRLRFAAFTRANVGITVDFILDGQILTSPVIRTPIEGGTSQIYGNFTTAETTRLAARLREPGVQLAIRPRRSD